MPLPLASEVSNLCTIMNNQEKGCARNDYSVPVILGTKKAYFVLLNTSDNKVEGSVSWGTGGYSLTLEVVGQQVVPNIVNHEVGVDGIRETRLHDMVGLVVQEAIRKMTSTGDTERGGAHPCLMACNPKNSYTGLTKTKENMANNPQHFTSEFQTFVETRHSRGLCCNK